MWLSSCVVICSFQDIRTTKIQRGKAKSKYDVSLYFNRFVGFVIFLRVAFAMTSCDAEPSHNGIKIKECKVNIFRLCLYSKENVTAFFENTIFRSGDVILVSKQ